MTGILAIETSTDACSVAVCIDGQIRERHEVAPRQHSQLLFVMLRELLVTGNLHEQGIEAIAYGCGPGSFTGLRIAASAVQGLAYSCGLPVIAVSTLAVLAQSALRQGDVSLDDTLFCTLDARIKEVYSAVCVFENSLAVVREGPWACAPADLMPAGSDSLVAVGNGCQFLDDFPPSLRERVSASHPQTLPSARDLIPLAAASLQRGNALTPGQAQPVYVRDEISWKKLAEQGKRS